MGRVMRRMPPSGAIRFAIAPYEDPSTMDLALAGRGAMVTGPAKGRGAAVTRAFAREGCRLALIGRDVDAIAPVAAEVTNGGGAAIVVACDVTDADQCLAAAERTLATYD